MSTFILFGTEGCHLCEEAEQIINATAIDFQSRDIMDNETWQQRYAIRIPVLQHAASSKELDWPFTPADLQAFVSTL